MITQTQIRELSDDIVRKFNPEKIILFGSYAYGTPTPDSDVDLLVILPYDGRSIAKEVEIRTAIRARFPLDLLAYPAEYVAARIANYDFFLREVVSKGEILYDANNASPDYSHKVNRKTLCRRFTGNVNNPG